MKQCIKCGGMARAFRPDDGVELSLCGSCKGMWFPRGMLARHLRTEEDLPRTDFNHVTATKHSCPGCAGSVLYEVAYAADQQLLIDVCPKCRGVYLDAQELKRAAQIARGSPRLSVREAAAKSAPPATPVSTATPALDAKGASAVADYVGGAASFENALASTPALFVRQRKEWFEIVTDFETRNKYDLFDAQGGLIGHLAEGSTGIGGVLTRQFFKARRPFEATVWNVERRAMLNIRRPFFMFFSDIYVAATDGTVIGSAHHKFDWTSTRYELRDPRGRLFGYIRRPWWRFWRFPLFTAAGQESGKIDRKWGGVLKEVFTSADTFHIELGRHNWTAGERAVILAVAIAIDLDFFEHSGSGGGNLIIDLVTTFFN